LASYNVEDNPEYVEMAEGLASVDAEKTNLGLLHLLKGSSLQKELAEIATDSETEEPDWKTGSEQDEKLLRRIRARRRRRWYASPAGFILRRCGVRWLEARWQGTIDTTASLNPKNWGLKESFQARKKRRVMSKMPAPRRVHPVHPDDTDSDEGVPIVEDNAFAL
jgi:hypothetical protein